MCEGDKPILHATGTGVNRTCPTLQNASCIYRNCFGSSSHWEISDHRPPPNDLRISEQRHFCPAKLEGKFPLRRKRRGMCLSPDHRDWPFQLCGQEQDYFPKYAACLSKAPSVNEKFPEI